MNKHDLLAVNNDPHKKQRIFFAGLTGFITGIIAAVTSNLINLWLFPDIPLYIKTVDVFIALALWAVLSGILAGLAAFSDESLKSILVSAVSMAFTILVLTTIKSSQNTALKIIVVVGLLFPFSALTLPLAAIFSWLARRSVQAASSFGWARWRIIIVNIVVIAALGIAPGLYEKITPREESGLRAIHEILQKSARADTDKALMDTEGFAEHRNLPYTLSQTKSPISLEALDITVHYDDGYKILCTVMMYPGSAPFIYPCIGGD